MLRTSAVFIGYLPADAVLDADALDDIFGCTDDDEGDECQPPLDDEDVAPPSSGSSAVQSEPSRHPVQGRGAPGQTRSAMPRWLVNNYNNFCTHGGPIGLFSVHTTQAGCVLSPTVTARSSARRKRYVVHHPRRSRHQHSLTLMAQLDGLGGGS